MKKMKLQFTPIILIIILLCGACCMAMAEDSNLISTDGLVAARDGYVYFVGIDDTSGNLNDGRETGLAKSVDIWRIKDEAGAQKELVKAFPVPVPGGVILSGGRDVIPCGDKIYFERECYKDGEWYYTLTGTDISTGEETSIFEGRRYSGKFLDGDLLYYYAAVKNNTATENTDMTDEEAVREYINGWFVANLRTGEVVPWEINSGENTLLSSLYGYQNHSMAGEAVFAIKDGYIYYRSMNQNGSDHCIKRKPVTNGNSETIVPYLSDYGEIRSCFVQGDLLYLLTEDMLNCIDINTRMLREAIPTVWGEIPVKHADVQYADWYLKRFNVSNGKVYYLKEDGLYVRVPGEGSETLLIPGDTREFTGLALSDHYAYLFYNDTMSFARIPLTASYLLDLEMLLWADTDHRDNVIEENGWAFTEYANCVVVSDYSGEDLTATVPAQIHGKPVTYAGLSWQNENRPLQALTIPEGVLVMGYLYSKNLQEISLPQSLISLAGNGYPYAFSVAEGAVIRYPGTETEWESLTQEQADPSYWGNSSYAKDITVHCNEEYLSKPESESVVLSAFSIPDEVLNSVQMTAQIYDDASEAISVTPLDLTGTDLEDFQDAYEYQLIQRANELYKSTVKEFGSVDIFIQSEERTRNYYISEKESLHNQYDANLINASTPFDLPALMVNGTIAYLKDGGMGVLEEMGSSFANKVVDMAEDQFGQSLTDLQNAMGIKALSKKDFVYSETQYGEQIFKTDDLKSLMMKAKENDGKFTSAEDAVSFIIAFQRNQIAKRSMQLAHDYKIKLMNRDSIEIVIDTLESVALSAVSGIINNVFLGGNSVVGLFVGRTVDTVFKSMDFIATEYKDPFIQDWKHDVRRYQAETVWLFRYDYEEAEKFIQNKEATDGWVHRWAMKDNPGNTIVITRNPDGNYHAVVHLTGIADHEFDFELDNNKVSAFFGDPFKGLNASLWVNAPETGNLKVIFGFVGNLDTNDPLSPYVSRSDQILEHIYVIADDTDDSDYYWDGWEEPVYLGREGVEELFGYLSDKVLLAASGAGAWEGRIKFDKDGGFTAYYYDEDAGDEIINEVYFTGKFDTSSIQLDGTNGYLLRASEISTQHTPGTEAVTDFGSRIVYEEPLFKVGETLLLTRPGTPDPEIPEMVQSEIGGVFGQWEDFETFITLSRLADGWGFFADETSPFTWDVEPFKTIRQPDPSLPLFGVDHDYTGWGAKEVFNLLSKQKMFSMDSSGNWTSEMRVNSDGSFYGVYYDYDITGLFISSFSGSFSTNVEWCGKTNGYLTVKDFFVKNEPYTNGITADGMEFMYTDGPFQTGERLFFTLPGTHTEDIPEDVRSHIYWYYDPFDNYLSHITINKIDWGSSWWLYADTDYPDTSDITPIALAEPDELTPEVGASLPSFGDDPGYIRETDQVLIYDGNDFIWGPGLFSNKAQMYNNELALASAVLSYGLESTIKDNIQSLFHTFQLDDLFIGCYDGDYSYKRWDEWGWGFEDGVFAIGKRIMSINADSDTTLLVVIGRGTMTPGEVRTDFLNTGNGDKNVIGKDVKRNISTYERGMWLAIQDYIHLHPIQTNKVKVLIIGHSLGGAMANLLGAHFTHECSNISWLPKGINQDDIYVYTFGAIRVLDQEENELNGYENIHNIYNYHDTFGPNGGKSQYGVSSPMAKFGHTDLFAIQDKSEGFGETKNHEMPTYISAIWQRLVDCESSRDFEPHTTERNRQVGSSKTDDLVSRDFQYEVLSDGTARITLYTGNAAEVHIPASLGGYPVSQIGNRAFFNNHYLDAVYLDEAPVTKIGYEAFRGCEKLRFVQLSKSVEVIQDMAFDYCIGLTEIVFFDQLKVIGRRAFSYCNKLGEVFCPDNLVYIDESAFDGCDTNKIWFHVDQDSHAEHFCAIHGYNYTYSVSGAYNPNRASILQKIEEIRASGNYADVWVNRWISKTKPELVLNITHNGDDTLHAALNAGQETLLSFDFIPNDNIPESIDMCSGGEEMSFLDFITMNIDAEEGYALRLEGDIQEFDKPALTGGLQWEDLLFTASEYMPDPLMYGFEPLWRGPDWDGHWHAEKDGHKADLYIANTDNESGYSVRLTMDETNIYDCSEPGFYDPYSMAVDFGQFAGMIELSGDHINLSLNMLQRDYSHPMELTMEAVFYYAGVSTEKQAGVPTFSKEPIRIMYSTNPSRTQDVQFYAEMFQRDNRKCYLDTALLAMTLSTAAYNDKDNETLSGRNIASAYRSLGFLDQDIMLFNYKGHKLNASGFDGYDKAFSIASKDMGEYTLMIIAIRGARNGNDDVLNEGEYFGDVVNVSVPYEIVNFISNVSSGLEKYVSSHVKVQQAMEKKKLKVLVTGYGQGAAVSNVLGASIMGKELEYFQIPVKDLFVYAFATPKVFSLNPTDTSLIGGMKYIHGRIPYTYSCANIFNILIRSANTDKNDPVTLSPYEGSKYEWQRFGRAGTLITMKTGGKQMDHHDRQNYLDAIVDKIRSNSEISFSQEKLFDQIYYSK